jgi:hypothetical protein
VKRAVVIARESVKHHWEWGTAFAEGLHRHGWEVLIRPEHEPCDLMVQWGIRQQRFIRMQNTRKGQICILERAYLGDVTQRVSVSFGGQLNGRATWRVPENDPSRWEKCWPELMKPWTPKEDGYVLVMGQVPMDMACRNVSIMSFGKRAMDAFRRQGFPVRFRQHPRVQTPERSLQEDLAGARAVVTWNSTSGVDAVLAGVPTVAMDQGSMAWPVTGHELKLPPMPDRTSWGHRLAWCQWTKEEVASGYCWEVVGL